MRRVGVGSEDKSKTFYNVNQTTKKKKKIGKLIKEVANRGKSGN